MGFGTGLLTKQHEVGEAGEDPGEDEEEPSAAALDAWS